MPLPVRRRFLMGRFIENVLMTVAGSARRTTRRHGTHASAGPPVKGSSSTGYREMIFIAG